MTFFLVPWQVVKVGLVEQSFSTSGEKPMMAGLAPQASCQVSLGKGEYRVNSNVALGPL